MPKKYLFHGSGKKISSKYLNPNKPSDISQKENCINGVYATDRKDIAIGMTLTNEKYTKSFGDYSKKPFQAIFVRGAPKQKYVYVYKISSKGFAERPKGSHQWVSEKNSQILKEEKLKTSELGSLWRKATLKEKEWYYKTKK